MPAAVAFRRERLLHFTVHRQRAHDRRAIARVIAADDERARASVAVEIALRRRFEARALRAVLALERVAVGVRDFEPEAEQAPGRVVPGARWVVGELAVRNDTRGERRGAR